MRTYPIIDQNKGDYPFAFEIENAYVGVSTIARLLGSVGGVTELKRRKLFGNWDEIHISFKYENHDYIVWEPFGDNSRYWIGPKKPEGTIDIRMRIPLKSAGDSGANRPLIPLQIGRGRSEATLEFFH